MGQAGAIRLLPVLVGQVANLSYPLRNAACNIWKVESGGTQAGNRWRGQASESGMSAG